jgi:serine/threonine-protein kinase HipA
MYKPVDAVEVRIWGRRAGAVALDRRLGFYAFEYDPRFVASAVQLAPIKMPLGRDAYAFPELPERSYHRLPALVADALPDRFGNALITAYLQREGVRERDITPLDRLAYMGKRAFGALEFRPDRGPRGEKPTALEMSDLVEAARKAVAGRFDSDAAGEAALVSLIRVGTSAGGARAKAAVGWNPSTGEIRAGQFDLPEGFEHWLLKFDGLGDDFELGVSSHYGRVELAYSHMARAAGIVMPDCRVYEEGGRAHFMVRRFDRDANRKHHVQTLCALAHLDFNQLATHDYAQWFMAALDLGIGEDEALRQMLARAAFNVMAANCDDHTKNLSFLMREGGRWELAPAYDLTHAFNPGGAWTYQHLMSVNGKFSGISRRDLLELADRFGVPGARGVLDRVASAVAGWPAHAAEVGLPPDDTQRVGADLRPGLAG